MVTKTWFHTGAQATHADLQAIYAAEGYQGDASAPVLAPSSLPRGSIWTRRGRPRAPFAAR